jgi:hypothetical protein
MKPENRQRAEALLAEHGLEVKPIGDGTYGIGPVGDAGYGTPRWPTDGYALSLALRNPGRIRRLGQGLSVFDDEDAPAPIAIARSTARSLVEIQ